MARGAALSAVGIMAMGIALLAPTRASAQLPPPPLNVKTEILRQKVDSDTCKVKLRITAEVPNVAKNTFETAWLTIEKGQTKPLPPIGVGVFKVSGSFKWEGNKIEAKGSVEAGIGTMKIKRSFSASLTVT
jgi:hypothetical protein